MSTPEEGKVLRVHGEQGHQDIGRVVLVLLAERSFWIVPFPPTRRKPVEAPAAKRAGRGDESIQVSDFEIRKPIRLSFDSIDHAHSLVEFSIPLHWRLSENELETGFANSDVVGKRAKIKDWYNIRNTRRSLVQPIFTDFGMFELLECGQLNAQVAKHAKFLGTSPRKLMQLVLLQMLGCGHVNALLPAYGRCGSPGVEKFSKNKVGRRRDAVRQKRSQYNGYVCSKSDRGKLVKGWRDFKKPGISEHKAFLRASAQYWPGSEKVSHEGSDFLLAPQQERPALGQFRRAANRARLTASRINMSDIVQHNCKRALRGTARDGIAAVGQVMLVDSTSEDETPVSEYSILDVLPSTWRTVVTDVKSEYIFGVHSGFENVSTLTALLALNNAAENKREFCLFYGIEIEEGEWYHCVPKRVRTDNGELKSELGIASLNDSEVSLEFTRSFGSSYKGPVEAVHKSLHAHADHTHAASTRGKQRKRGEPDRAKEACRTHYQNMLSVIKAILRHNNEVPVPHLLTIEMRKDNVVPTRRAIYEWCVKMGYVASEPTDIASIKIACLPRLRAVIARDGVHIFDPRAENANRHIKGLVYSSEWLIESGLCERGGDKVLSVVVQLDPNDLSRCYLFRQGKLQLLERRTRDPLAKRLTLCEHLFMMDADKVATEALKESLEQKDAQRIQDNAAVNSAAKKKQKSAARAKKEAGDIRRTGGKVINKARELRRERSLRLGIDATENSTQLAAESEEDRKPPPLRGASSTLMAKVRATRRTKQ